jgi:SAM-dependent methyltransferase
VTDATGHHHDHHHHDHDHERRDGLGPGDEDWDERYGASEQVWSGDPNGALLAEVAGLAPGSALDVGCGEGADAVWLARAGWDVTALDVSGVALERAARHAGEAGVTVRLVHSGLVEAGLPAGSFDLVSVQYPALRRTEARDAERALTTAVAPGGTLLVVHHAHNLETAHEHGFDPAEYVAPADVADLLDEDWAVEVDEVRPRAVPSSGGGTQHSHDVVLRARRLR